MRYLATQARQPVVHYEHTEIGYNYRLSNLLAALGRAQLARLDSMIERRRALKLRYLELFGDLPGVRFLGQPEDQVGETSDNYWLTSVLVDPVVAGFSVDDIGDVLRADDIEVAAAVEADAPAAGVRRQPGGGGRDQRAPVRPRPDPAERLGSITDEQVETIIGLIRGAVVDA